MQSETTTHITQATPNNYQAPQLQEVGDWQVVTLINSIGVNPANLPDPPAGAEQ